MNWKHSFYEIYALSIGQAFTLDEAHRVLSEFKEDRLFAIASALSENKRAQSKTIDSLSVLKDYNKGRDSKSNLRKAEAFLLENKSRLIIAQPCLDMAKAELAFIDSCLSAIYPNTLSANNPSRGPIQSYYQLVQPIELAFEYVLMSLHGVSYEVLRNIYASPYKTKILETIDLIKGTTDITAIAKLFAESIEIPETALCQTFINTDSGRKLLRHKHTTSCLSEYISSSQRTLPDLETTVFGGNPHGLSNDS